LHQIGFKSSRTASTGSGGTARAASRTAVLSRLAISRDIAKIASKAGDDLESRQAIKALVRRAVEIPDRWKYEDRRSAADQLAYLDKLSGHLKQLAEMVFRRQFAQR
jgi:hypothetical protein